MVGEKVGVIVGKIEGNVVGILVGKQVGSVVGIVDGNGACQAGRGGLQGRDRSVDQQVSRFALGGNVLQRHQHESGRENQGPREKRELHHQGTHHSRHRFADGCHVYP